MSGQAATPVALTIAGSDSSGGAGIQADLKTFSAFGVYGASVLTALTAQNTLGVHGVHPVPADFVAAQIRAVLEDFEPGAIKTGMLANAEIVHAVTRELSTRPHLDVVVDPVMVATSGDLLLDPAAVEAVRRELVPRAALLTPNLPEAASLLGTDPAQSEAEMAEQGRALLGLGCRAVLIKGGHGHGPEAVDILVTPQGVRRLAAPRIDTPHTHGTGCTLSAAIAALLALGSPLAAAVDGAKAYVTKCLEYGRGLGLGRGRGPLDHLYAVKAGPRPA